MVWDLDPASLATSTRSTDAVLALVEREGLEVAWILDTHPHADHLMASARLKERIGAPTGIGERVRGVAELWRELYHLPEAFDRIGTSTGCGATARPSRWVIWRCG